MSLTLKSILVFVVSVLLFAGVVYLADTGFYDLVQTRFYNPSIVKSMIRQTATDAQLVQQHIYYLQNRFAFSLSEPPVRRSFLHDQSAVDIYERSQIYGMLLEKEEGLQSVQFVDTNGIRMHFSTSTRDIINQDRDSTVYRNYTEDNRALSYNQVSVPDQGDAKFTIDDTYERIIFSFPFHDSMDVYRGTALFTVSIRTLAERLISDGRIKTGEDVSVTGTPPGVVFGSPETSRTDILDKVAAVWNSGLQSIVAFDEENSGVKLALISTKTDQGIFYGRLINDTIFSIPNSMKFILRVSMFLTLYLALFFLLNFKPDTVSLVQNRLKSLRTNLFEQLYVKKTSHERAKWILELEQRRDEIRAEIKRDLKMRPRGNNSEKNIDSIIDISWDELLGVIRSGSDHTVSVGKAEKIEIRTEVIEETQPIEDLEDIEEAEEAEEIEEIEEVQPADEEEGELDVVEEIDEVEEIEEVQSVDDEEDELDVLEEIEEVEEIEEIEELEEEEPVGMDPASRIEFSQEHTAHTDENDEIPDTELEIVSPFSSMFSSLDDDEKKDTDQNN